MFVVQSHVNSLFSSVSYRIGKLLIDPGDEWEGEDNASAILLTHAHFDHIYGLNRVLAKHPDVKVVTTEYGKKMLLDPRLNMSRYHECAMRCMFPDRIVTVEELGDYELESLLGEEAKAIKTPGHNPSCLTWIVGDALFSGDAYIPGVRTVTNLPGGNRNEAEESERIIRNIAMTKVLYPGHAIEKTIQRHD